MKSSDFEIVFFSYFRLFIFRVQFFAVEKEKKRNHQNQIVVF
jgi:hypothetical protein